MTDKVQNRWVKHLTALLAWIAGIAFVCVLLYHMGLLISASHAGWKIQNIHKHEGWLAVGLLFGTLAWFIGLALITLIPPVGRTVDFLQKYSFPKTVTILGFAIVALFSPLYLYGVETLLPATLGTKSGHVRITEDGRLMRAGETIPVNRWETGSKVVPLSDDLILVFDGLKRNGFSTRVTVRVSLTLREGEALRELLARHYAELPFVGDAGESQVHPSGYDPGYDPDDLPSTIASELATILEPSVSQMLRQMETSPTNGAPSELVVRSRSSAEVSLSTLPGWIQDIRVSDIEIHSWEKEQ